VTDNHGQEIAAAHFVDAALDRASRLGVEELHRPGAEAKLLDCLDDRATLVREDLIGATDERARAGLGGGGGGLRRPQGARP